MFCVIQEIERKNLPPHGYPKELVSEYFRASFKGEDWSRWTHHYSYEYFERSIKKAYKISLHHSFREDGKVKKKQYSLCTVGYYELAELFFTVYDYCGGKIDRVAQELNIDSDMIYRMVKEKVRPLRERIVHEFKQTEEYKTHEEHERITTLYALNKAEFNKKYELNEDEYDKCYDVFGTLQDSSYLEQIKKNYEYRKEYERKSRSYQEKKSSNYNYDNFSSYFNFKQSNYSELEKEQLKKFYKVLSKKFHPDSNPEKDTSNEMQLINKLKSEWSI